MMPNSTMPCNPTDPIHGRLNPKPYTLIPEAGHDFVSQELSMYLPVSLPIYLSIYLSIYLCVRVYLPACACTHKFTYVCKKRRETQGERETIGEFVALC